jgi:hypothetical protein
MARVPRGMGANQEVDMTLPTPSAERAPHDCAALSAAIRAKPVRIRPPYPFSGVGDT